MKLATVISDGRPTVAIVEPKSEQFSLLTDIGGEVVGNMMDVIRLTHSAHNSTNVIPAKADAAFRSLNGVRLAPPIVPPRNMMCVGENYRDHAREFRSSGFDRSTGPGGEVIPRYPIIFAKMTSTIIADRENILYPRGVSEKLDYEAELAVVIGRGGRQIRKNDALDHVFGYTIVNDVTARDLQARHKQWFIGKSLDASCPMGPWIVTADEIDPADLQIECWVNGAQRQSGHTSDLIFDVPALIETISAGITLMPGDVIATGTPAGVGVGLDPPQYLALGDEITIQISQIGRLSNKVQ